MLLDDSQPRSKTRMSGGSVLFGMDVRLFGRQL
jgi:hypothetical protein